MCLKLLLSQLESFMEVNDLSLLPLVLQCRKQYDFPTPCLASAQLKGPLVGCSAKRVFMNRIECVNVQLLLEKSSSISESSIVIWAEGV